MRRALALAGAAAAAGDVPVGAVLCVDAQSFEAHNERESRPDPTAHAEILAIRAAATALARWRIGGTLYVTKEPCAMCAAAIAAARIERVVFGCYDPQGGAAGSVVDIFESAAVNHRVRVRGGVLAGETADQLRAFFVAKRHTAERWSSGWKSTRLESGRTLKAYREFESHTLSESLHVDVKPATLAIPRRVRAAGRRARSCLRSSTGSSSDIPTRSTHRIRARPLSRKRWVAQSTRARGAYQGSVLAREPAHFGALTNLGTLYFTAGDFNRARVLYEQAIKSRPDDPNGFVNLGNVLAELGDAATKARTPRAIVKRCAPRTGTPDRALRPLAALRDHRPRGRKRRRSGARRSPSRSSTLPSYTGDDEEARSNCCSSSPRTAATS